MEITPPVDRLSIKELAQYTQKLDEIVAEGLPSTLSREMRRLSERLRDLEFKQRLRDSGRPPLGRPEHVIRSTLTNLLHAGMDTPVLISLAEDFGLIRVEDVSTNP